MLIETITLHDVDDIDFEILIKSLPGLIEHLDKAFSDNLKDHYIVDLTEEKDLYDVKGTYIDERKKNTNYVMNLGEYIKYLKSVAISIGECVL